MVSLPVPPSLLLVVTPSHKGEEHTRLLGLHPAPIEEYDPHARATAVRTHELSPGESPARRGRRPEVDARPA